MATSVDAKLLKSTKFPVEFNQKVDMQKVNVEVMKKWIAGKISEILGNEDDVVIELCFNLIEGTRYPDIKKMQIQLTGFLDKDTASFCKQLWKLCLSAQSNAQGVPKELLEAKKLELIQEKIEAEKAAEEARGRRQEEQHRDREINNIRNRERTERGRGGGGRGGDSWRGGRGDDRSRDYGGRGIDRGAPRYSRSPRRRNSRDRDSFRAFPPRESDSYVPGGRGGRRRDDRRRSPTPKFASPPPVRAPSVSRSPRRRDRSLSDSRSPPPRRRRSRSLDRRDSYRQRGNQGRRRSPHTRLHRRSPSPSTSLSRSPRPSKRRRSPTPASLSPSPSRSRRTRRESVARSVSYSRSPSRTPRRNMSKGKDRAGSSPIMSREIDDAERRTSARRGDRDDRRLTRSNSRSQTPPRRRYRSPSRSSSRGGRDRKRRRSLQRYEPANKRRRNSSSVSSPVGTRNTKADTEDESDRGSPRRNIEAGKQAGPNEIAELQLQASELREKLLREKIKKMRNSSLDSTKPTG